jgi:integrase
MIAAIVSACRLRRRLFVWRSFSCSPADLTAADRVGDLVTTSHVQDALAVVREHLDLLEREHIDVERLDPLRELLLRRFGLLVHNLAGVRIRAPLDPLRTHVALENDPHVRQLRAARHGRTGLDDPPSAEDVDTIISTVPPRWRLPLRVLEQSGMRVGEMQALTWGDVDEQASRFRVKAGKTAAARRWVAVPEWLMLDVAATCPREDRIAERQVFLGFTADVAKNVMARACKAAGIAHRHPHDLRHRYASVQISRGVPVTMVAAQLGHSRKSLTLDTYSHFLTAN